jgi:2-aminoadipate transaminase
MKANPPLATRTKNISSSAIREIFKALKDPSLISLAGGSPAAEFFPLQTWQDLITVCHQKYGARLYQYGITEGFDELKAVIAHRQSSHQLTIQPEEVIITTGAQSAIELSAKVFLDAGDKIILEAPTFLASLKTFLLYEPQFLSVEMESDGVSIQAIEEMISLHPDVKLLYLIPNFQNPSGVTLSLEKRKAIAQLLAEKDVYLIEDDPYRELRYDGEDLPSIHSMIPEKVIYIGSLSKIFSPGMRLGYFIAPPEIRKFMVAAKQATDVHTNILAQALATEFLLSEEFAPYLSQMKKEYTARRNTLLSALQKYFPSEFSWTQPEGGMFVWCTGPESFNATETYSKAIAAGVAFVPGTFFYAEEGTHHNTFRSNFTGSSSEKIEQGVKLLAHVCGA